ncbi:Uncharacterised protein [Streptococcus pneumoniae]|nr:Uncharacterised protein [Streptococcus pneumoniae]
MFSLVLPLEVSQPEFQVLLAQYSPYILAMVLPALVHLYHLQLLRVIQAELLVRLYHLLLLRATQAELLVRLYRLQLLRVTLAGLRVQQ